MKVAGLELAPLLVPLERRLQTGVVVFCIWLVTLIPIAVAFLLAFLLFTPLFVIPLAYFSWLFYDFYISDISSRGGRRLESMRKAQIWKYFRDYFPIYLIKTADLDPKRNYIIGYHPHGIIGCGAMLNFATDWTGFSEKYPGVTPYTLTLKNNFKAPVLRETLLGLGCCDVSKQSIQYITNKEGGGNAAIIVIGGADEALEATPGKYRLTLKNRKGFVKQALCSGASLVPVFSFGENDLFLQVGNPKGSFLRKAQDKFKTVFGISPPLFHGRGVFNYTFGFLPYRKPIHTVVGSPMQVEKCLTPSQQMIDEVHQKYMEQLKALFDKYKDQYSVGKNPTLEFI